MSTRDHSSELPADFDPSLPLRDPQWELFVQKLFGDGKKGMSGTAAYKAVGYKGRGHSAESAASALMRKVEVQARLSWLMQQAAAARVASKQEVAEILTQILRARQSDFLKMGPSGVMFHEITPATANQAALKKVKTEYVAAGVVLHTIELESKVSAARGLAELLGYNSPAKQEVTGANGGPIQHAMVGGPPRAKDIKEWETWCVQADAGKSPRKVTKKPRKSGAKASRGKGE